MSSIISVSSTTPSPLNLSIWTRQTLERLHNIFFSHTQKPMSTTETLFVQMLQQFEKDLQLNPTIISNFFIMVSIWGLVRMHQTEDMEARRQFGLFVNHLQDSENALLKSIQMSQKYKQEHNPVPPTQKVASLPLSL
jgi:hypothetical protein